MGWLRYRHPELGFELPLPDEWELVEDADGFDLTAVEPERAGLFRANVAVAVEQVAPAQNLPAWAATLRSRLHETLTGFYVLDEDDRLSQAPPCHRLLAHHEVNGQAVTLELWAWLADGLGYLLTGMCATLEYDDLADTFDAIAARFRPAT